MDQPETTLDKVEQFMNNLTDKDFGWQPFVFLKPEPYEFMDTKFLAKISLYYGPLTGIVWCLYLKIRGLPLDLGIILLCVLLGIVTFFLMFRFSMAIFWNRRAARIAQTKRKRVGEAF